MRFVIASCVLGVLLLAGGCSHYVHPKTTRNIGVPAAQPDKALLVIIRTRAPINTNLGAPIEIDGNLVGKIAPNSFMYLYLQPGRHTIQTGHPEMMEIQRETFPMLNLNLQAGQAYFYQIEWTNAPDDGNFWTNEVLMANDWKKLPEAEARTDLSDVENTPTFQQVEQLKAAGQLEFERDRTAR